MKLPCESGIYAILLQAPPHDVQKYIAIGTYGAMPACVHLECERMQNRASRSRHLRCSEIVLYKQLPHGTSRNRGEELSSRIRPLILISRLEEQRPRGNERKKHIRIHRQLMDVVTEFLVI